MNKKYSDKTVNYIKSLFENEDNLGVLFFFISLGMAKMEEYYEVEDELFFNIRKEFTNLVLEDFKNAK